MFPSQQPIQTLPPSSPFSHFATSSPSAASTAYPSTPPPPLQVPFGQLPGSHPGVLGWGVGMSAANGAGFGFPGAGARSPAGARSQTPTSVGWGSAAPQGGASTAQQTPLASRRRRRSNTPESEDEGVARAVQARPVRAMAGSAKRARMGAQVNVESAGGAAGAVGDLGKALASLDKPSLLTIFSKLLTTSPHLASTISSLLPTPSLSTILDALTSLERSVFSALPTGAFLRDDYIWSRVRVSLEEYVAESRRFLGLFVPTHASAGSAGTSEDDLTHPSTAFQFLHALTSSLLRLEAAFPSSSSPSSTSFASPSSSSSASPSPLQAHLTPLLLNAWHLFLTRLSSSINTSGRLFPHPLILSWFLRLDELCPAPPSPFDAFRQGGGGGGKEGGRETRRLMEGVRERMRREVGWTVGMKESGQGGGAEQGGQGGMQGMEEEL
ncbi:hypothetical protein JCM8547_008712 [Rhodosporidiobolus lusitaniae]